jgi:hypothetical protein
MRNGIRKYFRVLSRGIGAIDLRKKPEAKNLKKTFTKT